MMNSSTGKECYMNSSMENNEDGLSCEFKENLAILREIPFFSELPLDALKVLAYLCVRESFKTGDYLFQQKDDDGRVFYIIAGKARLDHQDNGTVWELRDVGPGSFFGGLVLLGKAPRLFSLKAVTDMNCLVISREKVAKVIEQFPEMMPKLLKAVVESVNGWEKRFLAGSDNSCRNCMEKIGVSLV